MKGKRMTVLEKEIMIETHLEEILIETGTIEEEGGAEVIVEVGVGVGVKSGCETEIETEAGLEAAVEHEAGKEIWENQNMTWIEQIH